MQRILACCCSWRVLALAPAPGARAGRRPDASCSARRISTRSATASKCWPRPANPRAADDHRRAADRHAVRARRPRAVHQDRRRQRGRRRDRRSGADVMAERPEAGAASTTPCAARSMRRSAACGCSRRCRDTGCAPPRRCSNRTIRRHCRRSTKALAKETDPAVKRRMEQARAAALLASAGRSEHDRLAAVAMLRARGDLDARSHAGQADRASRPRSPPPAAAAVTAIDRDAATLEHCCKASITASASAPCCCWPRPVSRSPSASWA